MINKRHKAQEEAVLKIKLTNNFIEEKQHKAQEVLRR